MNQAAVLTRLDSQVSPDGAVAIFGDGSLWTANTPWNLAVRTVIQEFLGEQRRAGDGTYTHHDRPYREIMQESPFNHVEDITVPVHRTWTADRILGYLYSTSFAAPHLFGDRLDEFDNAIRARLTQFGDSDTFIEENAFFIHVGRQARS